MTLRDCLFYLIGYKIRQYAYLAENYIANGPSEVRLLNQTYSP